MSEAALWARMRVKMGKPRYWREATRHEDKLGLGIADVSFVNRSGAHGWMELKKLAEYPKRESTIVTIDHYTTEQRIWLRKKGKAGGMTFLFLQIERDYYLFDWREAQNVGHLTAAGLEDAARRVWWNKMDWADFGQELCFR